MHIADRKRQACQLAHKRRAAARAVQQLVVIAMEKMGQPVFARPLDRIVDEDYLPACLSAPITHGVLAVLGAHHAIPRRLGQERLELWRVLHSQIDPLCADCREVMVQPRLEAIGALGHAHYTDPHRSTSWSCLPPSRCLFVVLDEHLAREQLLPCKPCGFGLFGIAFGIQKFRGAVGNLHGGRRSQLSREGQSHFRSSHTDTRHFTAMPWFFHTTPTKLRF